MTANEKRKVAELIGLTVDVTAGMRRAWKEDASDWYKRLYWQEWEPRRQELQRQIKELTGQYVSVC